MYKMIIVDDNIREREGVKSLIDWRQLGLEIVGEYSSGFQVIEHLKEKHADIILSDVEMPELNGIEMLKEIRKTESLVKIIYMSCYDEFDFAKTALNLDASGYVLKPIIAEELLGLVKSVLNIHEEQAILKNQQERLLEQLNNTLPVLRENFFRECMLGVGFNENFIEESIRFLKIDIDSCIRVASIKIDNAEGDTKNVYMAIHAVRELISRFSTNELKIYTVLETNYKLLIVMFYNPNYDENILELMLAIKDECYQEYVIRLSAGISTQSELLTDIPNLYRQAEEALQTNFFTHDNHIILYEQVEEMKNSNFEYSVDLQIMQKEIRAVFSDYKKEQITSFIDKYMPDDEISFNEAYLKSFAFSVINIIELILIEFNETLNSVFDRTLLWTKLDNFQTILNLKMWMYNIFMTAFEYLQESEKNKNFKIVNDIKQLVYKHYHEHLTIGDIAEYIHFSASHANNIFKAETGKTIFDFLTDLRMEKAKEFLRDPSSRIYQVALSVGYKNKTHFCMVFKQYVGFSPSDYKAMSAR